MPEIALAGPARQAAEIPDARHDRQRVEPGLERVHRMQEQEGADEPERRHQPGPEPARIPGGQDLPGEDMDPPGGGDRDQRREEMHAHEARDLVAAGRPVGQGEEEGRERLEAVRRDRPVRDREPVADGEVPRHRQHQVAVLGDEEAGQRRLAGDDRE